jgi:hypothetical protein
MKRIILMLMVGLYWGSAFSQIHKDSIAKAYVEAFYEKFTKDRWQDEQLGIAAINELEMLAQHENVNLRTWAQFEIRGIGRRNESIKVKAKALEAILKFSFDPDLAIRGNNANFYKSFPKEAFTPAFISELKPILHNDSFVNKGHVLLVGFLELEEEKDWLENHILSGRAKLLYEDPRFELGTVRFAAHMALARLGEKDNIDYVIRTIMDAPVEDILRKRLKYLSYIKQPETIEIFFNFLFTDKILPDVSGWKRTYANYVIPYIYDSVQDFPVDDPGLFGHSEEQIKQARDWVTAHRNDYEIRRDVWLEPNKIYHH